MVLGTLTHPLEVLSTRTLPFHQKAISSQSARSSNMWRKNAEMSILPSSIPAAWRQREHPKVRQTDVTDVIIDVAPSRG